MKQFLIVKSLIVKVMFTIFFTTTFASLFTSLSFAQTSSVSLRQKAIAESHVEGAPQQAASDASVPSAMLSLKDPRPEVITRTWKYFAGFKAQSFKAHGNVTTDAGSNVDLGENSSTFMPGLMMGFTGPEWQAGRAAWSLGLRGDASFASQGVTVTFPTGYSASDVRLNTMLFAVGPEFSFKLQNLPWLAFVFSPQYGNVNYTQTSSNQFARFSKQTSYLAWNYGLEMSFTKKWSVFSEYSQRNLRDSHQEIALQQNNFELGTRVAW